MSTANTGVQILEITPAQAGQRLDNFLLARLKGVPKSRIYRLVRKGEVRVNKGRIKPDYRLCAGDKVRVAPIRMSAKTPTPAPSAALRNRLEAGILRETASLLVVDKPTGLAVHGGSGVNLGLIEALREARNDDFLELVHRLDRGTSGCLMVARNRRALRHMQDQLRRGKVQKTYLALALGSWPRGLDRIDAPLLRGTSAAGDRIVRADADGKAAATGVQVVRRFEGATLLELDLETGRTHQIRVHCQLAGRPLAGDDKYGDDAQNRHFKSLGLRRLFLHAHRLRFEDPDTGETVTVEAPLPEDLKTVLDNLKEAR